MRLPDYIYLDIESIPTNNPIAIDRIAADIKPPAAMKKPETIKAWEENDKADAIKEAVAKTSFDGGYGHVCCISWSWNDDPEPSHATLGLTCATEKEVLETLASTIRPSREQPVVVGHYVADFDLRFLWQRAFVLGVKMPFWWPRDPKPWSKEVNDTMQMWAGAKGTVSLDRLCFYLGIEGKGDVDGSMVAGMFERGEYAKIAEYCKKDVQRVQMAHRRMLVAYGEE